MDLIVDIEEVDLQGVDRFKLSCKAEVGTNADRESVVLGPNSVNSREETSLPTLKFRFQNTNPTASLFFTFLDINGAPDQTELGSCLVRLILDLSHCSPSLSLNKLLPEPITQVFINRSQDQTWVPQTKQLHVALISSKIAGTELSKCIGKLRFTVTHSTFTPRPSGSSSQVPLQSRPTVTSPPVHTPTPTITGPSRHSTEGDSLKTQASVRSICEETATPESTLTLSNPILPPRVSIDAEQTLEEATGSETPQDSVAVSQAHLLSSILAEHDPGNLHSGSDIFHKLTEYKKAIRVMGSDIINLREENQLLREETKRLQTKIHEMESRAITSMSRQRLESLPKADLIQRIGKLEEELSYELQSKKSYRGKVQHLNNELIKKNEIEAQYIQLQEVHTAQQKLVQDLQSKIKKYKKCMQICQQQEATITQLEALLAQQAQGQGYTDSALLTRENAQLRRELQQYCDNDSESFPAALRARDDTIQSLKAELSSKCQELELQSAERSELKQQLIAAEARVDTLMAEIQENASKFAREKACYELQLAELRRREPVARGQQTQSTAHGLHNVGPGGTTDTHSTTAILNEPSLDSHKTTF